MLEQSIYQFFEFCSPYLTLWISLFFLITVFKILRSVKNKDIQFGYGSIISELPGLPLTLLHSVGFIRSIIAGDVISSLVFFWWGPGFILTALILLLSKLFRFRINWSPFALITSYACKINYVIFMLIYFYFHLPFIMFTFSAWIILDQINLAWFCNNADRTRRTFEDFWLLRCLYAGLLFIPIFFSMPYRIYLIILGMFLFLIWCISIFKVHQKGELMRRPSCNAFLRNIIYLSPKYQNLKNL